MFLPKGEIMFELGKRDECFGTELLRPITLSGFGRPTSFPSVPTGHSLICGYDQGLGERLIVCESLEDMQTLYDGYAQGGALTIKWYTGEDVGFVSVITGSNPES